MTHLEIATAVHPFCDWNVSDGIITHALALRGYGRHIALGKPGLSEAVKRERLRFAQNHIDWTIEQWFSILWSDETWVNGFHRKIWVTRRAGEEYEDTCLFSKQQRRRGWIFWGCFSGKKKGPCLFWEKSWKSINSKQYCAHILPLVESYITLHPHLSFMQDNAPAHSSKYTKSWLKDHLLEVIKWPSNSPDLNPIEIVWNWMKQWIQETYGMELDKVESQGRKMNLDQLKQMIQEAWDQITDNDLNHLVHTMKQRCQDVINANGGNTKW
jgi:ketohexokinase/beta-glucosidase